MFEVHGRKRTMFGTVAAISADNLGSLLLGGFKESCTAYKMCRHCTATQQTAKTKVEFLNACFYNVAIYIYIYTWCFKFSDNYFTRRNKTDHARHCSEIELDYAASKEHGVNRNSILNELRYETCPCMHAHHTSPFGLVMTLITSLH